MTETNAIDSTRLCLFTALIGRYEKLNEQPVIADSSIRCVCFTDDPDLRSDTWQVEQVDPLFQMDPVRSQRAIKIRPYEYLQDCDATLYIDNSVLLSEPPEAVFERYLSGSGFCLARHSFRGPCSTSSSKWRRPVWTMGAGFGSN